MMSELQSTEIPATITEVSPFIQSLVGEQDKQRLNRAWNYLVSLKLEKQELQEVVGLVEETIVMLVMMEIKALFDNDDDQMQSFLEQARQDKAAAAAQIDRTSRERIGKMIVNKTLEILLPTPEDHLPAA